MIDRVVLSGCATYISEAVVFEDLRQINFIYGANGSGKTTLSRVLERPQDFSHCGVEWRAGQALETFVYNQDFVDAHFRQNPDLPGVFTLGKNNIAIDQKIADSKARREKLVQHRSRLKAQLDGEGEFQGKRSQLEVANNVFEDACWNLKSRFDDEWKVAFEGARNSQARFMARVLREQEENSANLCGLEDLRSRASVVFDQQACLLRAIPEVQAAEVVECETSPLLLKSIVGGGNKTLADAIAFVGSSDWVRQGLSLLQRGEEKCPFCQQHVEAELLDQIRSLYDAEYERDAAAVASLRGKYDAATGRLRAEVAQILRGDQTYLDSDCFRLALERIDRIRQGNMRLLERKMEQLSAPVSLEGVGEVLAELATATRNANQAIAVHNSTVSNQDDEKRRLVADIWRYLLDCEIKEPLGTYYRARDSLQEAIKNLEAKVREHDEALLRVDEEIAELERGVTSTRPAVDGINKLLERFGSVGFRVRAAAGRNDYELIRPGGDCAKATLSEGERTLVSFLYFYQLCHGSLQATGASTRRVVVIDDPVSSLDSEVLFLVSSLCKRLFWDIRQGESLCQQVFVLTHNVYFHKQVTFDPSCKSGVRSDVSFWTIVKKAGQSRATRHSVNPVKSTYELLWDELRQGDVRGVTLANVMRRILEYYFRILGGMDNDMICERFDGEEAVICQSLLSWANEGSHGVHDAIHVASEEVPAEVYLEVFRAIFDAQGQLPHYDMMMGRSGNSTPSAARDHLN